MKFNERLLTSKIKENLKGVKNNLDREGKATAIAEALNFFDSKRDWVTKINRDEIISLVTNSPSQDVLCESIIEKVNATPFSKSLKESKKKKESKRLNESLTKSLNEQKLEEGTSNFYDHNYLPLLVFMSDEEIEDQMNYSQDDFPNPDDFESWDDYLDAMDDYKDNYYDKYYKDVCVLNEYDVDQLKADLLDFNGETKNFDYEDGEDTWTLEDIELVIKSGYYEGSQIYCENEKNFDYLSDGVKEEQLNRFNSFLDEMQKKYGLTKLSVAYRMSNGETGYNIQEELKNLKEAKDDLQTRATKMMSVKKYYIDMAWKNGKTWKTDPMTLDEIAKSVDMDKVTEQQFVDSMAYEIKRRKDAKNLTKAEIVKLYDYMNGKWQGKDVLWSIKGKTNESLDDTQKLIDNAKKFAKENNKDVKVKGLVNSNECVIDTFPEDFNEMIKLFNTKFDVYDEDSELERFKIKAKSTNESLNEEVTGMAKEFIEELKEFKQYQIDRIKEYNGYDYDDVDIDVGGQDYENCVDELLDIAQFYDREFDNLTHTIEAKVKDCVDYGMSIFEIVDYLIRDCKSEFNESLKEHISSKDLKDKDILDILGIEEEQRKVKNVGSYIKQYRQLLDKGYDAPKFEIYLKGDDAYYKKLGKVVDNSKDLVVIDTNSKEENLKEGYYDYMDKDYADILDKDVDVYDIKQFVLNDTNNEFRTHYSDEFALITCPNGKGCVVDYEAVGQDFDTLDSEIEFGIEENKDSEYTDENGKTHKAIRIFASHILTTTPKEVMEKAPKKTMKYRDFFRKYKYNDRCAKNFEELVSYIKKNGGLQENLKESYSIEQLASGETIDDYKDNCKKYNIKITQLDGDNIKLEGKKEDLINYYKEVVGVSEDMVDLKESCHSKKKRTLKEGYLGQTLEDFFYDCVDPEVIETVSLWGDDDEIYNGDYDGAIDEYGSNEFIEFDCGMDKVVINVDTSEEYQVTDYFIDVQDFVDCFNGDDIEVYDINTGETLFSGDRSELPDDVAEKIFVSFDAPKFISINIEEDGDRFDDDDDFDESLKENNNTLKLQNGGFAYISDYNKDQFEKEYVETGKYKKSGEAQSPKGKYTLYTNSVGDTYAVLDENLKEDTVKRDGKWVNKGNTGETHGEFKTKKEADKQRKAMFVNKKPNAKWGK